jgi:hypothetical protein
MDEAGLADQEKGSRYGTMGGPRGEASGEVSASNTSTSHVITHGEAL